MENLIGRKRELADFHRLTHTGASEFIAVYGRRRVGKTFLIREAFNNELDFYVTGMANLILDGYYGTGCRTDRPCIGPE